jgi:carboxypeptidase Q
VTRRIFHAAAVGVLVCTSLLVAPVAQQSQSGSRQRTASTDATAAPPIQRADAADLDAISKIKEEGLERSQAMDTLWYLTDVYGPRLTNSPNIRAAASWAVKRLGDWGIPGAKQDTWGPFGRGWANERFTANVIAPQPFPLIAFPRAWTPGTAGTVTAEAVTVLAARDEDLKKWEGKLSGKIVLTVAPPEVRPLLTPLGRRLTDQELLDLQSQPVNAGRGRGGRGGRGGGPNDPNFGQRMIQFFVREGVVATLEPGAGRNDHGTILVSNAPRQYRDPKEPPTVPQIIVASEHYNRIARLLDANIPVQLELNVQNRFVDDTLDSFNIVAEIAGTDRADEVVMLGAHFDSWHAGTGATDNAAGSAAMMEAMRILKASGLRLRRTVRLALWTGEEEGLLGSRDYVKRQFADPETMTLKPAHAKLSGYFNMDNGTGAIRGVYLQGNEAVRPTFGVWMEPFHSLGMTTLSIRSTGSTDHVAFDEIGLPGFQFIQDPLEYGTHSHHTNMDLYDRIQAEDLMKNSVIIASFVYLAANRDSLLPRKPLPKPRTTRATTTQ